MISIDFVTWDDDDIPKQNNVPKQKGLVMSPNHGDVNVNHDDFPRGYASRLLGYPNSWMVSFMENPKKIIAHLGVPT